MSVVDDVPTGARAPARPRGPGRLLWLGALAGPLYVVGSLVQAATRTGYDPTRHAWSLLASGELGWIHTANLIIAGTLVIAGAVGLARGLRTGTGATWVPRLIAGYGAGLVLAGIFPADPARGFPPGAPEEAAVSWHGFAHLAAAGVGFLAFVGACLVLARRFRADTRPGWAIGTYATAGCFLGTFGALNLTAGSPWAILAFTGAVILASGWLTLMFHHFHRFHLRR